MAAKLNPTQVGYLRGVPEEPTLILGPRKGMARKLVATGHVEASGPPGHFRRTTLGNEALKAFDDGISPALLELLGRIGAGKAKGGERGIDTLIRAELAWVGERSGAYRLHEAGAAILESSKSALSHAGDAGNVGPSHRG